MAHLGSLNSVRCLFINLHNKNCILVDKKRQICYVGCQLRLTAELIFHWAVTAKQIASSARLVSGLNAICGGFKELSLSCDRVHHQV
ncbi:hypothetical protein NIES46_00940 [Arthrospira platensis NIES-46]|uniref:Uncharacterized protein n=1 Tax=Limnospira platensis NIES-46 TaxID=1236695 RepID=A0A5M3T3I1_LIMPL|nr:hypothetical protein NIES46_00940 [Arthrospira platensis NIES-46]